MKLRKEHFVKLEKPEPVLEMDYRPEYGCQKFPQECYKSDLLKYEKDLKEWGRKYIKPNPKWKKFSDEKPMHNQYIYMPDIGEINMFNRSSENEFTESFFHNDWLDPSGVYDYHDSIADHWASVEEHQEKLKYFEEHQQIFEGWELLGETGFLGEKRAFLKKGVYEIRVDDLCFTLEAFDSTFYDGKNGPNAVEILKLICKDNDIGL